MGPRGATLVSVFQLSTLFGELLIGLEFSLRDALRFGILPSLPWLGLVFIAFLFSSSSLRCSACS